MSSQLENIVDHFIYESPSHSCTEQSESKLINQSKQLVLSELYSLQEIPKCPVVSILYTKRLKERQNESGSMALQQHHELDPKSIVQLSPLDMVGET